MNGKIGQIAELSAQIIKSKTKPCTAKEYTELAEAYAALYNFTSTIPQDWQCSNLPSPYQVKMMGEEFFKDIKREISTENLQEEEQVLKQAQLIHALFTINQECCLIPDQEDEEYCFKAAEELIDELFDKPENYNTTTKHTYRRATNLAICNVIAHYFNPIQTAEPNPLIEWYNKHTSIINNTLPLDFSFASTSQNDKPDTLNHQLITICQEALNELQMECVA